MNYDPYAQEDFRIIVREDYRVFTYMVDPQSHTHRNLIAHVQNKVTEYFEKRDVDVARRIESKANKRWYIIQFNRLDDAQMFYFTLANHITTRGVKFERFTS